MGSNKNNERKKIIVVALLILAVAFLINWQNRQSVQVGAAQGDVCCISRVDSRIYTSQGSCKISPGSNKIDIQLFSGLSCSEIADKAVCCRVPKPLRQGVAYSYQWLTATQCLDKQPAAFLPEQDDAASSIFNNAIPSPCGQLPSSLNPLIKSFQPSLVTPVTAAQQCEKFFEEYEKGRFCKLQAQNSFIDLHACANFLKNLLSKEQQYACIKVTGPQIRTALNNCQPEDPRLNCSAAFCSKSDGKSICPHTCNLNNYGFVCQTLADNALKAVKFQKDNPLQTSLPLLQNIPIPSPTPSEKTPPPLPPAPVASVSSNCQLAIASAIQSCEVGPLGSGSKCSNDTRTALQTCSAVDQQPATCKGFLADAAQDCDASNQTSQCSGYLNLASENCQ